MNKNTTRTASTWGGLGLGGILWVMDFCHISFPPWIMLCIFVICGVMLCISMYLWILATYMRLKNKYFSHPKSLPTESKPKSDTFRISNEAQELLLVASQDDSGHIMHIRVIGGVMIQSNNRQFIEPNNPRSRAIWEGALEELEHNELISEIGHKREIFQITRKGFDYSDILQKK